MAIQEGPLQNFTAIHFGGDYLQVQQKVETANIGLITILWRDANGDLIASGSKNTNGLITGVDSGATVDATLWPQRGGSVLQSWPECGERYTVNSIDFLTGGARQANPAYAAVLNNDKSVWPGALGLSVESFSTASPDDPSELCLLNGDALSLPASLDAFIVGEKCTIDYPGE